LLFGGKEKEKKRKMQTPTWVLKIDVPQPSPLSFEYAFKQVEQQTTDELKRVSFLRDEVMGTIAKASADAGIKAIERYIPSLLGLMHTVDSLPPTSYAAIRIGWTTPLFGKYQSSPFYYGSFKFEWHMILLAYGILHRNAAVEILLTTTDSDFEEKSKVIANLLCRAAGIFDFLRGEAGRWVVKPDPVFTEIKDDAISALSTLSIAEAQMFAIKKAVNQATSEKVVTKLCVDVVQKCESVLSLVSPMSNAYEPGLLTLVAYTTAVAGAFKALVFKYIALDLSKNKKYGQSIGHLDAAIAALPEDKSKNLKHLNWLYKEIKIQSDEIKRLHESYTNDNNTIYFEVVPDHKAILLPEGKGLMKPVAYVSPPASVIPFIPSKGSSCSIQ